MSDNHQEPKEYFVNRLSEQIGELEDEVGDLETRLEDSDWDPKIDYEKEIDEVKIALRDARERLSELEAASRKGWSAMYKETEAGLGELMTRVQTIREVMDKFFLE